MTKSIERFIISLYDRFTIRMSTRPQSLELRRSNKTVAIIYLGQMHVVEDKDTYIREVFAKWFGL